MTMQQITKQTFFFTSDILVQQNYHLKDISSNKSMSVPTVHNCLSDQNCKIQLIATLCLTVQNTD